MSAAGCDPVHCGNGRRQRRQSADKTARRVATDRCLQRPRRTRRSFLVMVIESCENCSAMEKLLPKEYADAVLQLMDETVEAVGLAKQCSELDDLSATIAVALLKLDLASNFVEQHHAGFIKEVNAAKQRVITALSTKH
jgi:hypothetical protein